MVNFKIQNDIVRQFGKFCLIGVVNTAVDFGIYYILTRWLGLYFLYANIIAIIVAMTGSFILNKYWTFGNWEKKIPIQYLKFALVNLVYLVLNNLIVFSLVHSAGLNDFLAKAIAVVLGLFWNFGANRLWTFKR